MSANLASAQMLALNPEHFIPHRAPMILIDTLVEHRQDCLFTETVISTQSAFFDPKLNGVPNYVAIEYMAQSVAALAGIEAKLRDDSIKVGFLLGSRKLEMSQTHFELGQSYQTQVTRLYQEDSGLAVFECQIFHQEVLIASANVNVFQPQDTQAFITDNQ